jgi:hypothetical protein
MKEEVTDSDDYADWIQWVSDAEQSRQAMYESTQDLPVPLLLQPSPQSFDCSAVADCPGERW